MFCFQIIKNQDHGTSKTGILNVQSCKDDFKRYDYIDLINKNPTRFLSGTDFVTSSNKTYKIYKDEVECTSKIYQSVNDEVFRNIVLDKNFIDYFTPLNIPQKTLGSKLLKI